MRKIKMAILGYGQRGGIYGNYALAYPEKIMVSAIIEIDEQRRSIAQNNFPNAKVYDSIENFILEKTKLDFIAICTQDKQHKEQAIALMEAGYDLLLEKPIANSLEDCLAIYEISKRLHRKVVVCHVLRYTPFYRKVKEIVDSGVLGKITTVHACEGVGYYHFAHSFVRGPWRNSKESSPVILAKCCHDMDIIRYMLEKKCLSVSSMGSCSFFNSKNAPEKCTAYCSDCPIKNCLYKAQSLYVTPEYRWTANYFALNSDYDDTVLKKLTKTQYDRCVFHCDNNVADHQETIMWFEDGITASLTLTALSAKNHREIKIYGSNAELYGNTETDEIIVKLFNGKEDKYTINLSAEVIGGHLGGDYYLMDSIYKYFNGEKVKELSLLEVSIESHLMSFAAEASREENGANKKIIN